VTLAARCVAQSSAVAQQVKPAGFRRMMPAELPSLMSNNSRRSLEPWLPPEGRALEGSRVQICAERWSVDAGKPGRPRSILREYVQLARARMSIDRVRGTCNTTLCRRSPAQRDGMLLGSWKSDRIRNNIELTTSLEAEFAALQTERITAGVAWRKASLDTDRADLNDAMVRLAAAQDAADAAREAATEAERRP
jgi:hypothetical protein